MSQLLRFVAITFEFLGTLILGVTLLMLHYHMAKATSIKDAKVVRFIKIERVLGIIAISLIAIGFVLIIIDEVYSE